MIVRRLDDLNPDGMWPGAHVVLLTDRMGAGLDGRRLDLELRDAMLVLRPEGISVAFLFRKDLVGTVAENVLGYGVGGLNIEACRIGTSKRVPGGKPTRLISELAQSGAMYGTTLRNQTGEESCWDPNIGRWPTNLVMIHAPECNGTCAPGCPVYWMDEQSGIGSSSTMERDRENLPRKNLPRKDGDGWGFAQGSITYTDIGGASRFFPQFQNETEMIKWIETLIGDGA